MFIAHQIKQQNIAEYLLYMWQVEDIIRAFNADIDTLDKQFISTMNLTDEQHRQEREWYESLIDMMRREDVVKKGHIQLVKNILIDLQDCHLRQLTEGNDAFYNAKYFQLLPALTLLKSKSDNPDMSDLEMCFVFLYGIMNLRRQHKEISKDTEQTAKQISEFIALLVKKYNTQDTDDDQSEI